MCVLVGLFAGLPPGARACPSSLLVVSTTITCHVTVYIYRLLQRAARPLLLSPAARADKMSLEAERGETFEAEGGRAVADEQMAEGDGAVQTQEGGTPETVAPSAVVKQTTPVRAEYADNPDDYF